MPSFATHLECSRCNTIMDINRQQHVCDCNSPLLVRYDLDRVRSALTPDKLAARAPSLWRYSELLPVDHPERAVTMGEGWTPLLKLDRWGARRNFSRLYLKDEGMNPTGTFKARGAAVGVTRARELKAAAIGLPTAGNAGGAWALYGARAGIPVHVAMPKDAPAGAIAECVASGAMTYLIDGLISDAGKFIAAGIARHGWYDASTLREPYRIEGKKTMGLELAEQFSYNLPDVIIYPCGGGVGLIAIHKAIKELEQLGWLHSAKPRLIAVQAAGCQPIIRAFEQGRSVSEFHAGAHSVAGGLRVPKALGDSLVLQAVRESGGTAVAVTDEQLLEAMRELAAEEGLLICPEGAAAVAALAQLRSGGQVSATERIVILNTGSGLKYTELVGVDLPVLPVDAQPE